MHSRGCHHRWFSFSAAVPSILIVGLCCGLPLTWIIRVLVGNPGVFADLHLSGFRVGLLVRTLGYNLLAAMLATLMGLPAALVMGRRRGRLPAILWILAPGALLLPSLVFGYGWNQFLRIGAPVLHALGITFVPGSAADVLRCVWTLSSWLWGVSACIVGLHLRQLDPDLQLEAVLNGATGRMTVRLLLGPALISLAITTLLATQEFAVYQPSGVEVVATEVQMVFSTGAFSSLADGASSSSGPSQAQRAAAAVMTAIPLLVVTSVIAAYIAQRVSRMSTAELPHIGDWPRILDASKGCSFLALTLLMLNLGVPLVALAFSLQSPDGPVSLWDEFGSATLGSLGLFGAGTVIALVIALSASAFWPRGLLGVAIVSFLLGGELSAIGFVRVFNRPGCEWVSQTFLLPVIAYQGRFAMIALWAARVTWLRTWDSLREQAALCGAGPVRTAVHVVWPMAWPALLAGALLVGAFSLTETPSTSILVPQHPPVLITRLLIWAHVIRSDRMIEAAFLIVLLVAVPTLAVAILVHRVRRRFGSVPS